MNEPYDYPEYPVKTAPEYPPEPSDDREELLAAVSNYEWVLRDQESLHAEQEIRSALERITAMDTRIVAARERLRKVAERISPADASAAINGVTVAKAGGWKAARDGFEISVTKPRESTNIDTASLAEAKPELAGKGRALEPVYKLDAKKLAAAVLAGFVTQADLDAVTTVTVAPPVVRISPLVSSEKVSQ